MPRANWGVNASDVDDFDRDSQYKPYDGPVPPNAVYLWRIKVLKYVAGARDKFPQLRIGIELVPRGEYDERRYKGYFTMMFAPISDRTQFRYVPFLDAIGVTATDFTRKTITDEEGNIKRIGPWRNDGQTLIKAELKDEADQNGNPRKGIGWVGPNDDSSVDDDEEEYDVDTDEEEEYEEEAPAPKRRNSTPPRRGTVSKAKPATRRRRVVEDEDNWS